MTKNELLNLLAEKILNIKKESPILVCIDGVNGAGKTTLISELVDCLKKSNRQIVKVFIDGFHNPRDVRYAKGRNSAEGYYYDSYNYEAITKYLLQPLKSGNLEYKTVIFNHLTDSAVEVPTEKAEKNAIVIMEGIFMQRPELINYWDYKIFLDINFEVSLKRVLSRTIDKNYIGSEKEITDAYNTRYIPGQKIYLKEASPF